MDHGRAPVLEALQEYRRRGDVSFSPPGHKQGRGVDPRVREVLGAGVFESDVLLLNGLDDRRESQGVLTQAQQLMADAVGAEQAFFSTCGSSLSVKSCMVSVAGPGEKLLLSRNAHKSVILGVILGGIDPAWVHPRWDAEQAVAHPPEPDDVRAAFEAHPDAKGMLLITPTDWGTCADIAAVAAVCHERDRVLIVDEAWGAHLPFHPDLPVWGMNADADLVVTSVHKMGGAIEQSSVFHLQGNRVDPAVLQARADMLATTSASPLVYATLDGWRRQMVEQGEALLGTALERARRVRDAIRDMDGLLVLGEQELLGAGKAHELDPLKIVIDVTGLGVSGYQAAEWMRAVCHVDLGAADTRHISGLLTHADDDETERVLLESLGRLCTGASAMEPPPKVDLPAPGELELEMAMLPRDAFFAEAEQVPVERAAGRIAAELLSPYPPGVPVVAPGEVVTKAALDYLTSAKAAGALVSDASDSELSSIRVVARRPS